jgi:hypothetical protein
MRQTSFRRRAASPFTGNIGGTQTALTKTKYVPDGSYTSIDCESCGAATGSKCKSAAGAEKHAPHAIRKRMVIRIQNASRGIV